jgi:hypothetical protein
VRALTSSDLHQRRAEWPQLEQRWLEATFRWRLPVKHETPLDVLVLPGDHDGDREAQAPAWKWVRHKIANDTRSCFQWLADDDPGELRGDVRRDPIREREEAHPRCRYG